MVKWLLIFINNIFWVLFVDGSICLSCFLFVLFCLIKEFIKESLKDVIDFWRYFVIVIVKIKFENN